MAKYKYSTQIEKDNARAVGVGLQISTKASIEICSHIRGKKVQRSKTILNNTINKKEAIPYKRFNGDVGHKAKIGPGRYPVKASKAILKIIESAESNARFKGLNTDSLIIKHISAQKAAGSWHYGRKRRRQQKSTHIEVVVKETAPVKKATKKVKEEKPEIKKDATKQQKGVVKAEKKEIQKEPKKEVQTQEAKQ